MSGYGTIRSFAGLAIGVAVLAWLAIPQSTQGATPRSLRSRIVAGGVHNVARQIAPDVDPEVTTVYRGTLGESLIQMSLSAKPDEPGGYEGEYFVFGGGQTFLLAGEIDEQTFYLEESEDGHAISGWWEGKFVVDANRSYIVGKWQSADEMQTRAFKLERVMRTRTAIKRQT